MTFKARIFKSGETTLKKPSSQQTTRYSGTSNHQAKQIANILRPHQVSNSQTPRYDLFLQAAVGNQATSQILIQAKHNANDGPVVQMAPSERGDFKEPEKQGNSKCSKIMILSITKKGNLMWSISNKKMARRSDVAIYNYDYVPYRVEFLPSAFFTPSALSIPGYTPPYSPTLRKVKINRPKGGASKINAGAMVDGFPVGRFKICP